MDDLTIPEPGHLVTVLREAKGCGNLPSITGRVELVLRRGITPDPVVMKRLFPDDRRVTSQAHRRPTHVSVYRRLILTDRQGRAMQVTLDARVSEIKDLGVVGP